MKILHITYSDKYGGANIAAARIHNAMLKNKQNSYLLVIDKKNNLKKTIQYKYFLNFITKKLRPYIEKLFLFFFRLKEKSSLNILNSNISSYVNKNKFDVINLHWVNNEMMSLKDIPKLNGKVFWTLHDTWPIDYFFHYPNKEYNFKKKFNLSLLIKNKINYLNIKKISLICPSNWMKAYAKKNQIIKNCKITVIRNPINLKFWKPLNVKKEEKKIILFGSVNVSTDKRKGLKLFLEKLKKISKNIPEFKLLIFGDEFIDEFDYGFEIINLGYLDKYKLRLYYNKANVYIINSTQDNLPNTAIEAMACGTPVITVKNNGLKEIIRKEKNGIVLNNFSNIELIKSINWSFKNQNKLLINKIIRQSFSEKEISRKYIRYYKLNG